MNKCPICGKFIEDEVSYFLYLGDGETAKFECEYCNHPLEARCSIVINVYEDKETLAKEAAGKYGEDPPGWDSLPHE